jgi:AraC-like DNA-binding protein
MKDFDFESRMFPVFAHSAQAKGVQMSALLTKYQLALPGPQADRADTETRSIQHELMVTKMSALSGFVDDVAQKLSDEHFGISTAQLVPKGAYGVAEFLIRASPTVREAFDNLLRYSRLLAPDQSYKFEETKLLGSLHHVVTRNARAASRHVNEFGNAFFVSIFRTLCAAPIEEVWFANSAPASLNTLREFFQTDAIRFDAPTNGFSVHVSCLGQPTPQGDSALFHFLEDHAKQALASRPAADALVVQLRQAVGDALKSGEPNIERIAIRMKTSARTLQRKLGAMKTTFQDELDAVRNDLAQRYLGDARLDLTQVTYLLGYSELRAFERAFKRWSGLSPAQWRKKRS